MAKSPPAPTVARPTAGARLVAEERRRQIEVEGFTTDHDDRYTTNELSRAAACYANEVIDLGLRHDAGGVPFDWPWDRWWWKPSDDPVRNLVKAGALFRAEQARLERRGQFAQARLVAGSADIVEKSIDRRVAP